MPTREVDQSVQSSMSGQMSPHAWAINGAAYPKNEPQTDEIETMQGPFG